MKTRKVKAIFKIAEDKDIAGISFKVGNNRINWRDLTSNEQMNMLNAWLGMYELFSRFLKKDGKQ